MDEVEGSGVRGGEEVPIRSRLRGTRVNVFICEICEHVCDCVIVAL